MCNIKGSVCLARKFRVKRIVSRLQSRLTMSIEAPIVKDSRRRKEAKHANGGHFLAETSNVNFFSASPFSLLFSLSQKVALILLFFWVGFFQRISALFSSCVRCWKGQQVLPFSQTLDIRENRKWQKVWAPLLLLFRICAPILVMSLLHKTKDSFKGGKEITNYFTQKQSLRKIWPLKKR